MSNYHIRRLPISQFREFLDYFNSDEVTLYLGDDFGVFSGSPRFMAKGLLSGSEPVAIEWTRCILVLSGSVEATFNLHDYSLNAGTMVFVSDESIVQIRNVSEDTRVVGCTFSPAMLSMVLAGKVPHPFSAQQTELVVDGSQQELTIMGQLMATLNLVAHEKDLREGVVPNIIAAIVGMFVNLYRRKSEQTAQTTSRQASILDRFITLVSQNCQSQHALSFYADSICITQRYLGTVVKQTSGQTAKEWIDKALIAKAKVLLRHSDMTIVQVSEALSFPNPSFFSKFFRNAVGMPPKEYRKGGVRQS